MARRATPMGVPCALLERVWWALVGFLVGENYKILISQILLAKITKEKIILHYVAYIQFFTFLKFNG